MSGIKHKETEDTIDKEQTFDITVTRNFNGFKKYGFLISKGDGCMYPVRKNLQFYWFPMRMWEKCKESHYDEIIYRANRLGTSPDNIIRLDKQLDHNILYIGVIALLTTSIFLLGNRSSW